MNGRRFRVIAVIGLVWGSLVVSWGKARGWGEFVEPGFPYVAATVDARNASGGSQGENLIVRGVVVFLGDDMYACYDTDLLRLAAVWRGDFLNYKAMAPHTYYNQGKKNQGGQKWISTVAGEILSELGIYSGGYKRQIDLTDPRTPAPDPREIGRGPVDSKLGSWLGTHVLGDGVVVKYSVGDTIVREQLSRLPDGVGNGYLRHFRIGPSETGTLIVLGEAKGRVLRPSSPREIRSLERQGAISFSLLPTNGAILHRAKENVVVLSVAPSEVAQDIRVVFRTGPADAIRDVDSLKPLTKRFPNVVRDARRHWLQSVQTRGRLGRGTGFVVDEITLPERNPWQRQVRVADTVFLPDQRAAVVTFDGDVWLLTQLTDSLDRLTWRRIASGLHEPQSINWRDGKLFVYTRNGLIRLNDLNGDGEIDFYETFSNRFTQTGETREFPNDSVVTRDGGFLLAKPGQQAAHQGRDNGTILYVSPDGKTVRQLATGFRQPYLGYRSSDDLITASDQQGHWVPTTPIHWIRNGGHYGFRPSTEVVPPGESVTSPICWIPHRVVQSATSQVWVESDKMGPLNGRLLCLDYYRANTMLVHFDDETEPRQGAVSGVNFGVDLPVLKGDVNPHDGWLYLTGFQIWGSYTKPWSGIRRVRYLGGEVSFPSLVRTVPQGIVLGFEKELDESSATELANYHVGRWNYRRTKNYGSGHYKLDGEPGTEVVGCSGVVLSSDRRSVLVVIPDMQPVMQMELVYRLQSASGRSLEGSAYATVHHQEAEDLTALGFATADVEAMLERPVAQVVAGESGGEVSAAQGEQLYQTMGCMACHSLDGTTAGRSGPTLKGVFGTIREFAKGRPRSADAAYIKESILNPPKNVLKAYATSDIGMPSYQGILSDQQIESLVAFIRSLTE